MEAINNNQAFSDIFVEFENNRKFDGQGDQITLSLMLLLEIRQLKSSINTLDKTIDLQLENIGRGQMY